MKINHIRASNFVGARAIDLPVETPVVVVCGENGAGKSSLAEAISAALTGDISRVSLKKEYGSIVTEGKKKAEVVLSTDHGDCSLTLPDGKWQGLPINMDALPYVLRPSLFAEKKDTERRTFLFGLTGITLNGATVKQQLIERECNEKKVDTVLPMLRSGFPAACDFAKDKAKEAKGAWKGVTGETWGSDKGDGWEAEVPEYDAKRLAAVTEQLATVDGRIEEHSKTVGSLSAKRDAYVKHTTAAESNATKAKELTRLTEKLAFDEAELAKAKQALAEAQQRAGTAPREGLVHDLARGVDYLLAFMDVDGQSDEEREARDALAAYEKQYGALNGAVNDPEARAAIPALTQARDLMARSVANDKRLMEDAKAAAAALELSADVEKVTDEDIGAAQRSLDAARQQRGTLTAEQEKLRKQKLAADTAAETTKKAAQHHADISEWLVIADQLATDGIPGEMLANALKPINAHLEESSVSTTWPAVTIDSDMTIRYGKRLYSLCSESERWRADAMIAVSISCLSGLKLVLLDRMDVLQISARGDLLAWLDEMADFGDLDTAFVFATLKQLPTGLSERMAAHWIESGAIAVAEATAETA
ncbi:AAA family ATPase [Paraburkholderia silviterrae]|uniref:Recombinase RecF n=1 Tax=Paraburkholderia silviterrae TaxID=2528715 RepID=A0A4R5MF71_9BURK|nr:AAA family ATPase [Paraburkholderia silviterrae]TDG25898.1 recombinase RecF [Paraburkholderia silviterrae]